MMFEAAAVAEAGGWASEAERQALAGAPLAWAQALRRLILETDDGLRSAHRMQSEERQQVIVDLREERNRLAAALQRLTGEQLPFPSLREAPVAVSGEPAPEQEPTEPAAALVQASWADGRLVVWAGAPDAGPVTAEGLEKLLAEADAAGIDWERHSPVPIPGGGRAEARSAPIAKAFGWLVGVGSGAVVVPVGPSVRWMGEVAVWGTQLVAEGRMVPLLRGAPGSSSSAASSSGGAGQGGAPAGSSRHRVRWVPALLERERLAELVARMPGAVVSLQSSPQPDGVCRSVLSAVVDSITRYGAGKVNLPAALTSVTSRVEISEAVLAGLDGHSFNAPTEAATRLGEDLKRWSAPVTSVSRVGLTVRLDPPSSDGGWLLSVVATGVDRQPLPVENALVVASGHKAQQVEAQLRRLERLLPVLRRPTTRRGQVILDSEEAADLMFNTGPVIAGTGFEVLLPAVSTRRASPRLRMHAEALETRSQVGVAQLANVRWSVCFDDLELDAASIARLAKEAKPLVQVRGRWVSIDRADLASAAAALAERAAYTQLTGAELLRHAMGLEGALLGGPLQVEGTGWAVELLRGATTNPPAPLEAPTGFVGKLRHYQAEAAGWLAFLERSSLGGCLAMDMGLGKTPTVLAHLLADKGGGPTLVICPPAVLSNWRAEANRFTPKLRVAVHHGPRRADPEGLDALVARYDAVLTTYGTAVRDMDHLSKVHWKRVVVDEAQAIKNHNSDTARSLRRLGAGTRLALTGTPVENGLGDLWSILDFVNPGLVGGRTEFVEKLSRLDAPDAAADEGQQAPSAGRKAPAEREEGALRALNGLLVFRRTKSEPEIAAELPDKVDKLDSCAMTAEQVGLYQAVLDRLIDGGLDDDATRRRGQVLAAITGLKQICDHPEAYLKGEEPLEGRSGKLARLEEILTDVFAAGERVLIFTHFARWGERLSGYLTQRFSLNIPCYHGGLARTARDKMIADFQGGRGPGALVLSIKAGGSGLNLTAANHVVLYDRWWNPAVEDQARDRAWRLGQASTVVSHRMVCPGTVDERVEEIVAGKRRVAGLVLPARSSLGDLDAEQLRAALGLEADQLIEDEPGRDLPSDEEAA